MSENDHQPTKDTQQNCLSRMQARKRPFVQQKLKESNTNLFFLKEHVQDIFKEEGKLYKKESLSYKGKKY